MSTTLHVTKVVIKFMNNEIQYKTCEIGSDKLDIERVLSMALMRKLDDEIDETIKKLKFDTKPNKLMSATELATKDEIRVYILGRYYTQQEAEKLLKCEDILEKCYQNWSKEIHVCQDFERETERMVQMLIQEGEEKTDSTK